MNKKKKRKRNARILVKCGSQDPDTLLIRAGWFFSMSGCMSFHFTCSVLFSFERTGIFELPLISLPLLCTTNRNAFDTAFLYVLSGASMQRRFIFYFFSEGSPFILLLHYVLFAATCGWSKEDLNMAKVLQWYIVGAFYFRTTEGGSWKDNYLYDWHLVSTQLV